MLAKSNTNKILKCLYNTTIIYKKQIKLNHEDQLKINKILNDKIENKIFFKKIQIIKKISWAQHR
jgi:hypothetical protein